MNWTATDTISSPKLPFLSLGTFQEDEGPVYSPERKLMTALLFDGVITYLNYAQTVGKFSRSRFREAFSWVHSREGEYIFSFDNVCEYLGINPDSLRTGLESASMIKTSKKRRARR